MKKENKKVFKGYQELSYEQVNAVKSAVVASLGSVFENTGVRPDDSFYVAAENIANGIINTAQMALIEKTVFDKAVKNSKPLKKAVKKIVKKTTKKITKK